MRGVLIKNNGHMVDIIFNDIDELYKIVDGSVRSLLWDFEPKYFLSVIHDYGNHNQVLNVLATKLCETYDVYGDCIIFDDFGDFIVDDLKQLLKCL